MLIARRCPLSCGWRRRKGLIKEIRGPETPGPPGRPSLLQQGGAGLRLLASSGSSARETTPMLRPGEGAPPVLLSHLSTPSLPSLYLPAGLGSLEDSPGEALDGEEASCGFAARQTGVRTLVGLLPATGPRCDLCDLATSAWTYPSLPGSQRHQGSITMPS